MSKLETAKKNDEQALDDFFAITRKLDLKTMCTLNDAMLKVTRTSFIHGIETVKDTYELNG